MKVILLFILGTSIGSFLNVLIDRLPQQRTVIKGRSHCDHCKHTLAWNDLIPLFSFVLLSGKCRYCKRSISVQYPIVELVTGVLFVLIGFKIYDLGFMNILELGYVLFIISSLVAIFFTDLKYGIIPDAIVFPGVAVSFVFFIFNHQSSIINHFLSALGAGLFFFLLFAITRGRGMGFGDVKFSFLLGLFLEFPNIIIALYVSFLTGAAISIILVVRKRLKFKGTIPFGPFLAFGAIVAYFLGDTIIWFVKNYYSYGYF